MSSTNRVTDDPEWDRWAQISRDAWAVETRWAKATLGLARTVARGDLDGAKAVRAYLAATRRIGSRHWRAASQLGAEYTRDMVLLTSQIATEVLDEIVQSQVGAARSASDASDVDVHLTGPTGGLAVGSLTVTNRHPRTRRIEISAGPVMNASGTSIGALHLQAQPAHVTLASGDEAQIALCVDLSATTTIAGERYESIVSVTGGDEATLTCRITVS